MKGQRKAMAKFIRVSDAYTGRPMLVNVNCIEYVRATDFGCQIVLTTTDVDSENYYLDIDEAYEEVDVLLPRRGVLIQWLQYIRKKLCFKIDDVKRAMKKYIRS